jgi:tricorn protease
MENYGVQPDLLVDNKPEDVLAGRDRQLEAAIEELMKQLNGSKRNLATEGNQQK